MNLRSTGDTLQQFRTILQIENIDVVFRSNWQQFFSIVAKSVVGSIGSENDTAATFDEGRIQIIPSIVGQLFKIITDNLIQIQIGLTAIDSAKNHSLSIRTVVHGVYFLNEIKLLFGVFILGY